MVTLGNMLTTKFPLPVEGIYILAVYKEANLSGSSECVLILSTRHFVTERHQGEPPVSETDPSLHQRRTQNPFIVFAPHIPIPALKISLGGQQRSCRT